jgi:hypothetical protein
MSLGVVQELQMAFDALQAVKLCDVLLGIVGELYEGGYDGAPLSDEFLNCFAHFFSSMDFYLASVVRTLPRLPVGAARGGGLFI